MTISNLPKTIVWESGDLFLLNQTLLPAKIVMEKQESAEDVWHSIHQLKVRGAPAIGVAVAYGLCIAIKDKQYLSLIAFNQELIKAAEYLDSSRPTAINLKWALDRMLARAEKLTDSNQVTSASKLYDALVKEAITIHYEDIQLCRGIGESGLSLIKDGMGILTHCNAGALATSELGTATAPMYLAHEAGVNFKVFADETRPLLQGARLTSWELQQSGIDVTLITDSMAAHIMSQGLIDLIIVGSDRVAANGDIANKIGTLSVAINAKHFGIPFYVAFPSSTVDLKTSTGTDIIIEERDSVEVTSFGGQKTAPDSIKVRNPAFDVTPHELITGLITEKGIIRPPFSDKLKALIKSPNSGY